MKINKLQNIQNNAIGDDGALHFLSSFSSHYILVLGTITNVPHHMQLWLTKYQKILRVYNYIYRVFQESSVKGEIMIFFVQHSKLIGL